MFWLLVSFRKDRVLQWTKTKNVSDEESENSKFLYVTLKMRNLPDMNDLYVSFIWNCRKKIRNVHKMHGYNPWRCNSTSSLRGYIEWDISKVIITLPTNIDTVVIFQKTLTRGFSCINTWLDFDIDIFMPNQTIVQSLKRKNY